MGYLQGLVNKAKWYMSEAQKSAALALRDKELAGSLAQKAEKSTIEAGALAKTTARLEEETTKLKKWADTSAGKAEKSNQQSQDALVQVTEQVQAGEDAKNQTLASQEKVKNVADISLVDIQVAKQEAMKEIEWAIEKNNVIV